MNCIIGNFITYFTVIALVIINNAVPNEQSPISQDLKFLVNPLMNNNYAATDDQKANIALTWSSAYRIQSTEFKLTIISLDDLPKRLFPTTDKAENYINKCCGRISFAARHAHGALSRHFLSLCFFLLRYKHFCELSRNGAQKQKRHKTRLFYCARNQLSTSPRAPA